MTYTDYDTPTQESLQIARTSCKDCVFAIFDGDIKTQIGCSMGRIDIYRAQNPESVIEAYDEEKEFYVINNRICNLCRNSKWAADKNPRDLLGLQYAAIEEASLKFDVIVIANDNINDVEATISFLMQEEYKPRQITIIRKPGNQIRPAFLRNSLSKLNVKWRMASLVNPEFDEREMVDESIKTSKCGYIVVVKAGSTLPPQYLKNLDFLWNKKLIQLGTVISNETDKLDGMMINKAVHTYLDGNTGFDIEYKLQEYNNTLLHKYSELI